MTKKRDVLIKTEKFLAEPPNLALLLHNRRMFDVMRWAISGNVRGIKDLTGFFREIKSEEKIKNITNLKNGKTGFTVEDITNCCKVFGIDANFFFVETHTVMMRPKIKTSPFQQLLQAVQRIGVETGAFDEQPEEETEAVKLARTKAKIEAEEKRKKDNFEYI